MLPLWLTFLTFLSITAHAQPQHAKRSSPCKPRLQPTVKPTTGTVTQIDSGEQGSTVGGGSSTGSSNTSTTGGSTTGGSTSAGGSAISFPSGCLTSSSGYGIGIDYDTDPKDLVSGLDANPCVYGRFYELKDWNDLANQGASMASLANGVNAILMLSLKTSNTYDYSDEAIASVATALNGLNLKQPLWLRFGHEMTMNGPEGNYPPDPAAYVKLWIKVATKVDRKKVKMYWCMNPPSLSGQSWDNLASWASPWHPGDDYVDINGIDTYADSASTSLQDRMSPSFCQLFGSKPIFNGEVGVFGASASAGDKTSWVKKLTDASIKSWCPSYVGFAWFEINKEGTDYTAAANGILKAAVGGGGTVATA